MDVFQYARTKYQRMTLHKVEFSNIVVSLFRYKWIYNEASYLQPLASLMRGKPAISFRRFGYYVICCANLMFSQKGFLHVRC